MFKRTLVFVLAFLMTVCIVGCKKSAVNLSTVTEYSSEIEEIIMSENTSTDSEVSSNSTGNSSPDKNLVVESNPSSNNNNENNSTNPSVNDDDNISSTEAVVLAPSRNVPKYSANQFGTAGFWAPYELNETTLTEYKNAGFNTLLFCNHSLSWTSDNQFYLGSNRTMKALELCKKVGLKAIIPYNDWIGPGIEGKDFYGSTPFSKHDIYGEYKDIIVGVSISDEPNAQGMEKYANKTFIDDFKKVYPNQAFQINLIPITANSQGWGYKTYEEMLNIYEEKFMKTFKKPYISLDLYPFHLKAPDTDKNLVVNYRLIAERAKKYNAETTFILQSSTGNEFKANLTEGDMRWQVNAAIAFGADNLQYYCYAVPIDKSRPNNEMYNYCILNPDNTPSKLYDYVKTVNAEAQSLAPVALSYNWDSVLGVEGSTESAYRVSDVMFNTFKDAKHYISATATHDLIVSRFMSKQYGEGYMFVNFADGDKNKVEAIFTNCGTVAVYGGKGNTGKPQFIDLDKNGKISFELDYGEGVFVTPLV